MDPLKRSASVPHRRSSWPSAVAGTVESAVGDLDQLDGTPGALLDQLVAHFGERLDGVGRQTGPLEIDFVGPPLMMNSRSVHRLLRGHAVVYDIHDRLEHRNDDARTPGAAEDENDPAVLLDQGRGHRRQRPLAGSDGVRFALSEAVEV